MDELKKCMGVLSSLRSVLTSSASERIRGKIKDVQIDQLRRLETLIERVTESSNSNLKKDIRDYKIARRVNKLHDLMYAEHQHNFNAIGRYIGRSYDVLACLNDEPNWNPNWALKAGFLGSGFILFGIGAVVPAIVITRIHSHLDHMEEILDEFIEKLDQIWKDMNFIFMMNQI